MGKEILSLSKFETQVEANAVKIKGLRDDYDSVMSEMLTKAVIENLLRKQNAQLELRVHDWLYTQHTAQMSASPEMLKPIKTPQADRLKRRMKEQGIMRLKNAISKPGKSSVLRCLQRWKTRGLLSIHSNKSLSPYSGGSEMEDVETIPTIAEISPSDSRSDMAGWRLNLERAMVVKNRASPTRLERHFISSRQPPKYSP